MSKLKNSTNKKIKSKKEGVIQHLFVLILFSTFSVFITYPLIFNIGNLATGMGDEFVMAWIHNWEIHALLTNPLNFFQANLYYPYNNTLAFSDSLIVTSILAMPIQLLLGEPIVAVNFTLLTSLALLGFSLYLLAFYLTKDRFVSVLAGILVVFSPAVLSYTPHLQNLAVASIPLSILCFLKFTKTKKTRFLVGTLVFLLLQVYNSFMPAYFLVFSLVIVLILNLFHNKKQILQLITKKHITIVLGSLLLIIPIGIPYFSISKEFNYVRDIRDSIHFAIQPEDLLYTNNNSRLYDFFASLPFNQISQNNEFKAGYIGLVFSLLALLTIIYFIKSFKKNNFHLRVFTSISIIGLILSLGPALHLGRQTVHEPFPIPLPYALFYYVLPGFQGFRNSARWEMLFILAIAIAISIMLSLILKKVSPIKRNVLYVLLMIGIIAEFNFPMHFIHVPQKKDFPKVDYWLATTPKESVVLHMPIYNWGSWPFTQQEIYREYYSTMHFRRSVNGYTSFSPPEWQKFIVTMDQEFPSAKSLSLINNLKVNYIIVDKKLYDQGYIEKQQKVNGKYVVDSLKRNTSLRLIKQFDDTYVFEFSTR